jgi:lysine-specific demethylase 3
VAAGKGTPRPATKQSIHARHAPIHRQQFYLDVELRKALWEEYGVL